MAINCHSCRSQQNFSRREAEILLRWKGPSCQMLRCRLWTEAVVYTEVNHVHWKRADLRMHYSIRKLLYTSAANGLAKHTFETQDFFISNGALSWHQRCSPCHTANDALLIWLPCIEKACDETSMRWHKPVCFSTFKATSYAPLVVKRRTE